MRNSYIIISLFLAVFLPSCKKYVTVDPPSNVLVNSTTFASDQTAVSAMLGIYSKMGGEVFVHYQISEYAGLSADEFRNHSTGASQKEFFENSITANNITLVSMWKNPYNYIYQANSILEGVAQSTGMSAPVKKQLEGEAKFMRAFCHFYLVNLFGD